MNNKRRRFSTFFGVAVVLVMALAACGSAVQTHPADLASADPAASNPGVDNHLPADFQITAYEGEDVLGSQEVQFTDLLGQGKPIVPNLWAGLCPPCRLEMPDFEAVSEALGDQVLFFGLDVGPFTSLGTSKDGRQLVKHLGITYPTGTTTDAEVVRAYGLLGTGTLLISVTVGAALFRGAVASGLRAAMPHVHRLSALFLAGAGAYLVYYWLFIAGSVV